MLEHVGSVVVAEIVVVEAVVEVVDLFVDFEIAIQYFEVEHSLSLS